MKYRIEYSNGVVVYRDFKTVKEAEQWRHTEGDHVVGFDKMT